MPSLVDIADHADVPVSSVLRFMNGDRVGEAASNRIRAAIEQLGSPHEGIIETMNVLSPSSEPRRTQTVPEQAEVSPPETAPDRGGQHDAIERARETLLETLADKLVAMEDALPHAASPVSYEAFRLEVAPVARRVGRIDALVDQLIQIVRELEAQTRAERRERLDDLKLLIDLIVTGWQGVDRRLGHVERMFERVKAERSQGP
jgi:hypothetical protein